MALAPYRKLIAAFVGIGLMLVARHTGVDLDMYSELIVEAVIAVGTLAAVYQVKNDQL